jgi:hypothetical protein
MLESVVAHYLRPPTAAIYCPDWNQYVTKTINFPAENQGAMHTNFPPAWGSGTVLGPV